MKSVVPKKTKSLLQETAIKVFPVLKQERTQSFFIIALTFLALTIFGLFAIEPTIATILQLQKQLADDTFVYNELVNKVNDLSILQGKYLDLQPDLSLVLAAVPSEHNLPELIGQTQVLAAKKNVQFVSMQSDPFSLTANLPANVNSFTFSLTAQGSRQNILDFIASFMSFERITTINEITLNTTNTDQGNITQVIIQGKAYFKPL